jgi:hypothetical protein
VSGRDREIMVMRRAGAGCWQLPAWERMLDLHGHGAAAVDRQLVRYGASLRHTASGETWMVFSDAEHMAWWVLAWA